MRFEGKNYQQKEALQKAVRHLLRESKEQYEDLRSNHYLKMVTKEKKDLKKQVNIAFIVQMSEIWDKEEPVYAAIKEDPRFSATMIVVPPYDQINQSVETDYTNNYFLANYPEAIKAYQNNSWIAIDNHYDYVFYQRPYDHYLPMPLRSRTAVKVTKCCYIPYGYTGSDAFNGGSTNRIFFRNLYLGFPESAHMAQAFKKRYRGKEARSLHKICFCGFPALTPYFNLKPTNECRRILWTPRWSYAPQIGGSHFLEYKETIINFKKESPEVGVTFRPHPLLFGEMVSSALMSKQEVNVFLEYIAKNGITYDNGCPIFETLQNTDILITDYSSVIIQFFLTGRPIVYCESDIVLNDDFKRLAEGMYIVHNEEELIVAMKSLSKGIDPLRARRQKIIAELRKEHEDATSRIIETVLKDYQDSC